MAIQEKIWYAFRGKDYTGTLPEFYNPGDFDWVKLIESKYSIIHAELKKFQEEYQKEFVPYFNSELTEEKNSWMVCNFIFWDKRDEKNCSRVPQLLSFFQQIPGLLSLGISVLDAHTEIRPHEGDTNAIMRCHLGIDIPGDEKTCGIRVGKSVSGWKEGKVLLFCDAHEHEAWNRSDKQRVVLIFDVMHPNYISKRKSVTANVYSWLDLQRKMEKSPRVKKFPGLVLAFMRQYYRLKYVMGKRG